MIDHDLNLFFLGIVKFPFGRLEITARFPCHDLDLFAAQSERGTTAIHRRVSDPNDQHLLTNCLCVLEGDRFQPVDTDMNAVTVVASGDFEIFSSRCPSPNKNSVVAFFQ